MNDLDKAREWAVHAKSVNQEHSHHPAIAAAEVIQSLPDQWVDAEKLRYAIESLREGGDPGSDNIADALESLLPTPSLPTLADMAPEEREARKWMQAQTWHEVGIILWVDEASEIAQLITRANGVLERKFKDVTPLPDLPKLECPGSGDVPTVAEQENVTPDQAVTKDVCNCRDCNSEESSRPRPEDVPTGEPWLVMNEGCRDQWVGTRDDSGITNYPWVLAKIDGTDYALARDVEVTLVSRLVPEVTP